MEHPTFVRPSLSAQLKNHIMEKKEAKRFLSIRLLPAEFKEVSRQYKSSGCRSLTEYAKKALMSKPVTIKPVAIRPVTSKPVTIGTRNESTDELLHCLIEIKSRLDALEGLLGERMDAQLRQDIADIRSYARQLYEKWSQL